MVRWFLVCLSLFWLIVSTTSAGEIADLHQRRMEQGGRQGASRPLEQIMDWVSRTSQIGLEKSICFGNCMSYSAIINSDGTFVWHGFSNVMRKGRWTGRVSTEMFRQIAMTMQELRFQQLADNFELPVTDQQSVYTMEVIDNQRKIVRNYGQAGPMSLWAIEQLIEKMLVQADWQQSY